MENKKLFVKVKLESAQYSPDLTGQKGFGGKVMFPLEAVYSDDHFTMSEIRENVADALGKWSLEVFATEKAIKNCLETVMSRPGSYYFLPSGDCLVNPDEEDLRDVFYVNWDLKEYSIRSYIENAYFEDGEIIPVPVVPGSTGKAMVTAYQSSFDVGFGIIVCGKKQFWKSIRAEAENGYLDLFSPYKAKRKAVAALIGSEMDVHIERSANGEHCELLNAPDDDVFGVYCTEGDRCYAILCAQAHE